MEREGEGSERKRRGGYRKKKGREREGEGKGTALIMGREREVEGRRERKEEWMSIPNILLKLAPMLITSTMNRIRGKFC